MGIDEIVLGLSYREALKLKEELKDNLMNNAAYGDLCDYRLLKIFLKLQSAIDEYLASIEYSD